MRHVTTPELDQWLDGACPATDNYTTYLRIRGNSPPGYTCHPYTLQYIFESGYCR